MLMGIHGISVLNTLEDLEKNYPMPRKQMTDRTIYVSQPMPITQGAPSICDLSEARFGDQHHRGIIMPDVYRAPEVILDMEWSYPVDIWALGMTVSTSKTRLGISPS